MTHWRVMMRWAEASGTPKDMDATDTLWELDRRPAGSWVVCNSVNIQ